MFILISVCAQSQHYDFASSVAPFTPVSGIAVDAIEADDQISGTIPIGFSFTYFGTAYTDLKASSNGFLTFNLASGSNSFNAFNDFSTRIVAPLWDDLHGSGGTATYSTTGAVGSRVFTFEWINWKWNYNAGAAGISFQVKLFETSNAIQFIYQQEAGALVSPSASIGLVGVAAANRFYSLDNTSASPTFSPMGNNALSTKPATNQAYTFTPGMVPAAPGVAATQITTSANSGTSLNLSWTNGNGTYRAVFMKQTSALEDLVVSDGAFANASSTFGNALFSSEWYCVYNGTGNSVSVLNLSPGLPYRIQVVEYNGLANAQRYLNTPGANNPINLTTTLIKPVSPISSLTPYRVSATQVSIDIVEGNGTKRAVFMKAGTTTGTAPVVDNTTYTANATFGTGSQIGNTGWFCVFNGPSTSVFNVTGLSGNTDYVIHVIDYNGPPGSELYNIGTTTGNPVNFKTFINVPVPSYTFAASAGTFTPLTGSTAVPSNQGGNFNGDDVLSSAIPIGFTFKYAGVPFTQLYASSNGFITFNAFITNVGSATTNDLANSYARPVIAPFWDDNSGAFGQASYLTSGDAPNRVFTIEYLNWAADYNAVSPVLSFQVKLYETLNKVEFIYRKEAGTINAPSASIGLGFANMGSGNFVSLNNAGAAPVASVAVETSSIATAPVSGQVYSFTPVKLNQVITFPPITDRFFGNGSFSLNATTPSGLPITYETSNPNVATVAGTVVTITGVGSVTITASQGGNDVYNEAAAVQRAFIVNKGNQAITFSPLNSRLFSEGTMNLSATATSMLPISFQSSNPAVATVSGSTVTFTGVGTTDITASQAGNGNYNPAQNVVQTLTVNKGNQIISITPFGAKTYGDGPFEIVATTTSNLPLTFMSSNPSVATVSGPTITIVGAGFATITASQSGNAMYNSGSSEAYLNIAKASQTIDFPVVPDKTFGDAPFTLHATASSGLPVTFSINNSVIPNEIAINGNVATIVWVGSATIRAFQGGNANFNPASSEQTFCVRPAKPVLTVTNDGSQTVIEAAPVSGSAKWFKDGVQIFPNMGLSIPVTEPGLYSLVTQREGCESLPSDPISLIITGMDETADAGVNVFPNPVMDELEVDVTSLHEKEPVQIELFDVSGRTLYTEMVSKKTVLKMDKHKAGAYILRVIGSKRVITKQIIKK